MTIAYERGPSPTSTSCTAPSAVTRASASTTCTPSPSRHEPAHALDDVVEAELGRIDRMSGNGIRRRSLGEQRLDARQPTRRSVLLRQKRPALRVLHPPEN